MCITPPKDNPGGQNRCRSWCTPPVKKWAIGNPGGQGRCRSCYTPTVKKWAISVQRSPGTHPTHGYKWQRTLATRTQTLVVMPATCRTWLASHECVCSYCAIYFCRSNRQVVQLFRLFSCFSSPVDNAGILDVCSNMQYGFVMWIDVVIFGAVLSVENRKCRQKNIDYENMQQRTCNM